MTWAIRRLVRADAEAYREIRLEALRAHPEAFGGSYEREEGRPLEAFADNLDHSAIFAATEGGTLAGTAGLFVEAGQKVRHRATLFGVYVRPAFRGRGCAAALIEAILAHAEHEVIQVHLSVGTDNIGAIKTYERAGFETYGTDPRALCVGGRYIDEYLMVRLLKAPQESDRK